MTRFCWTIGGGMSPANSMAELQEFYGRSGNLQSSFRAFEVDDSGASRDITSQVVADPPRVPSSPARSKSSAGRPWWQFWRS